MGSKGMKVASAAFAVIIILVLVASTVLPAISPPGPANMVGANGGQSSAQQYEQRIGELQQFLATDPNDEAALSELGDLYFLTQQFSLAEDTYRQVVELNPDNVDIHLALGVCSAYQGDMDAAIDEYERVLELDSDNVQAHYNMGVAQMSSSPADTEGAIASWQMAIKLDPNGPIGQRAQQLIDQFTE